MFDGNRLLSAKAVSASLPNTLACADPDIARIAAGAGMSGAALILPPRSASAWMSI